MIFSSRGRLLLFTSLAIQCHCLTTPLPMNQVPFEWPLSSGVDLPVDNSTRSFWLDTPGANPLAEEGSKGPLTDDADVCVIGSGISGVSVAYHLSQIVSQPLKTVIFEARRFCSGATGRNGGHVTPYNFRHFATNEAQHGTAEAIKSFAIEDYTAREIERIVSSHGLENATAYVHGGHIGLFVTEEELAAAKADFKAAQAAGINLSEVVWISPEEMKEQYGPPFSGVRNRGHNIWPLKFVTELLRLAKGKDPRFELNLHTLTPVLSVTPNSEDGKRPWQLETSRGAVKCSYVVHATNAYASHLLPQFSGPKGIVPTRGQVVAVRSNVSVSELTYSSWDGNHGYWHPVLAGNESAPLVILGGSGHTSGSADDSNLDTEIGRQLTEFLPALFPGKFQANQEPELHWSGIMGYTELEVPFVGPVISPDGSSDTYRGQYISAGFSGHGMPRTYASAQVVAELVKAELFNEKWTAPEWLPQRFLTWNR